MEFYNAALILLACAATMADAAPPAYFVFGDSLVDSGNNNYISTTARANSYPYGIDYPTHRPTGRFSNGYNIPDYISMKLGAESALPYLDPALRGNALLRGANFASAGVGILNDTGIQFANIIRMPQQFQYFQQYKNKVSSIIGKNATDKLVAGALVTIALGGNDYVNNYYLVPVSLRSLQYSLTSYSSFIISEYKKYLAKFYELGARRVLVLSTGPLGCSPAMRAMRSINGECAPQLMQATALFNSGLKNIVDQLNNQYSAQIYTMGNSFPPNQDVFNNPQANGFSNANNACCGQGLYNGIGLCTAASNLCADRDSYVFWDQYHPSQRAIKIIVDRLFSGSMADIYPVNLNDMLKLDV
uniref:Uncharacterized protein n=1 Tax=Picea sitchensis TaxID=3332 RepID=A9NQA5_PICSI|nr:unknown [Picea sitchensis]